MCQRINIVSLAEKAPKLSFLTELDSMAVVLKLFGRWSALLPQLKPTPVC